MADEKRRGKGGTTSPEHVGHQNVMVNGGDIQTAVQGFDGRSFEDGYPEIMDMHNNQGARSRPGGRPK